jgi:uncharacterized RDD family membrane protein YckC
MEFENPYSPPAGMEFKPAFVPQEQLKIAGQGKRFINFILDQIFTSTIAAGVGFMFGLAYAMSRENPAAPMPPAEELRLQLMGNFLGLIVTIIYFITLETICQRSLAKFITGTRVVRNDGGVPTVGQIVGRTFARFIPFEVFSFFGHNGYPIGWHDSLSKTKVVEV